MNAKFNLKNMETNEEFIFPEIVDSAGNIAIDLTSLYSRTGILSYDYGLQSTAIWESSICSIDGKRGILTYRGYNIKELVRKNNFFDVAYLLIIGHLPSKNEISIVKSKVENNKCSLNFLHPFVNGLNSVKSPINNFKILFSAYVAENCHKNTETLIYELFRDIPILVYMACTKNTSIIFQNYSNYFGKNFLINYLGAENIDNAIIEAFEKFLILHAEHEQNASTFIVQACEMTGSNLLNCMLAGVTAIEGNYHGGASEQAFFQLQNCDNLEKLVECAKSNNCKIAGLGHRIYKAIDPRAAILKEMCEKINPGSVILQRAINLENLISKDEYFKTRKIFPNIDLYSGIFLESIGIPPNLFIMVFILARFVGWIAHYKEIQSKKIKIIRPHQLYQFSD